MYIYIYTYIYVYVCINVHVFIYIHIYVKCVCLYDNFTYVQQTYIHMTYYEAYNRPLPSLLPSSQSISTSLPSAGLSFGSCFLFYFFRHKKVYLEL